MSKLKTTLKKCAEILGAKLSDVDLNASFESVSIDSRTIKNGELFFAIKGENFDGHHFVEEAAKKGAIAAVVSQPVDLKIPQIIVDDTILALGQLAQWHRQQFNVPVIAVTGSCGKTTTKAMLASIFSQRGKTLSPISSFNNNIGLPLTLLQLDHSYQTVVLELGANHPGEIAGLVKIAKPQVAAVTIVAPVHLEGFGTLENIAAAKGEIFAELDSEGVAVINADDPSSASWQQQLSGKKVLRFARQNEADLSAKDVAMNAEGQAEFTLVTKVGEIRISLPVLGEHNITNALAASACALACDLSLADIKAGLEAMKPVAKRMIRHQLASGAILIDDTYNANPLAFKAAISVLRQTGLPTALVMGDMGELGSDAEQIHRDVGTWVQEAGINQFFTFGRLSAHASAAYGATAKHFTDIQALLEVLRPLLNEKTVVLVKGSRSMRMENVVTALLEQQGLGATA
jgi:UDP-N-acetylmuramoyl-tripeptide--D-alanyl-D-alanine ligase